MPFLKPYTGGYSTNIGFCKHILIALEGAERSMIKISNILVFGSSRGQRNMYIYDRRGYDIPFFNKYREFRVIQIEGLQAWWGHCTVVFSHFIIK